MKRHQAMAIAGMLLLGWSLTAEAKTVTEGALDIQNLAAQISGDLKDYSQKRDRLVDNIKSVQKGIRKLQKDYTSAETRKDKTMIKALTLKETSQLLDFYSQFYHLNVQKVKAILPKLEKMRESARRGAIGRTARQLQDPVFKKNLKTLYANLSTFAMKFNDASLKKEVAGLLRENELLYQQGMKGTDVFNDMVKNIDKVSGYLKSIYARTVLRSKILQRKKFQTELAVELMQYALALRPIEQAMMDVNPEGVMEIPEINISEFVDPVISDSGSEETEYAPAYSDPDVDAALRSFHNGPTFLK